MKHLKKRLQRIVQSLLFKDAAIHGKIEWYREAHGAQYQCGFAIWGEVESCFAENVVENVRPIEFHNVL